jgi:hypothetical protein
MSSHRHSSRRQRLPSTQPEIRLPPLTERPTTLKERQKRDTLPSRGSSQRGTSAANSERATTIVVQLVQNLSSSSQAERLSALKNLKIYVDTADRAREISSILPPNSSSKAVIEIRAHCLKILSKEIR